MTDSTTREHLFISYATENRTFAEWLALRLTAEGYKVWCDRTHLLGGESYPDDIDDAIKNRTFRLLALLSHASLHKANPKKERTSALSIARERGIDFLIPLNVDGLSPAELDWMTSDLTFISFHPSWTTGLAQLLKKLEAIGTPRGVEAARGRVCNWMDVNAQATIRDERLWANVLPVIEVPAGLYKFELQEKLIIPKIAERWAFFNPADSQVVWALTPPAEELSLPIRRIMTLSWRDVPDVDGLRTEDLSLAILRKAIMVKCLERGMKLAPKSGLLYYPQGLLPEDHLRFTSYEGKKTYVSAIGERTFRSRGEREINRYHLSAQFRLTREIGQLAVRVSIHLHLVDLNGYPLEGSKVISRRKRICRDWWNHQWISRFMAVVEWLCNGDEDYEIMSSPQGSFRIASKPVTLTTNRGIDESQIEPTAPTEQDTDIIDEDTDDFGADLREDNHEEEIQNE